MEATIQKPRELTWQSAVGAFVVSSIVSMAFPYVVLKLGLGPNVSVVSAFLGALFLGITARKSRGNNALQNNIIQTAGTAASSTAFMCVVAAAFGYLEMNESVNVKVHISPLQMWLWLTPSGMIGVLFTTLFRKTYLDDPEMKFVDGVVAAETVTVLDSNSAGSKGKMRLMGLTAAASAVIDWLRDAKELISGYMIKSNLLFGVEYNLLTFGSGLLGLNMALSTLIGCCISAYIIGPWLKESGIMMEIIQSNIAPQYLGRCNELNLLDTIVKDDKAFMAAHCGQMLGYHNGKLFATMMLWTMWLGTGMMVAAALTALLLKWRTIVDTFRMLNKRQADQQHEDISVKTVFGLGFILTALLAIIQKINFNMEYYQTVIAVIASLPLMLIGMRVLGQTNQGPISLMANALQAVFAVFWPTSIGLNLVAAGVSGSVSAQGEGLIQDFKTGRILKSTTRILTWVQFAAVPIGAAAVAIMYPLLVRKYHLGGDGLAAPTGLKIANMAVLLSKGTDALPRYALQATIVASVAGVLIEIVKHYAPKAGKWLPSPSGLGFAMILPGTLNLPMAIGGITGWLWLKKSPKSYALYAATVASGFIGGEAIVGGIVLPILGALGIDVH